MTAGRATVVLAALGLLAGCGGSEPTAEPTASAPASEAAPVPSASAPAPEAAAVPVLKAASYPPRDECSGLPGWKDFRGKLEAAVAQRNVDALSALVDPAVELDFGGGSGVKEMRRRLDDKVYKLWDQLAALLPLGCAAVDNGAAMPWIFAKAPEDADPYTGMLALGSAVPVYAKADAALPPIAALNWAMVAIASSEGPGGPFTKVTLPDGSKTGFVETAKLRSLIDYRVTAIRSGPGWRITSIIAGD